MVVGVVCNTRGVLGEFSRRTVLYFSTPRTAFRVYRMNLQLSTCMVCLCKYHNSITNLFSPAFQQLKSLGSGICYPLGNF